MAVRACIVSYPGVLSRQGGGSFLKTSFGQWNIHDLLKKQYLGNWSIFGKEKEGGDLKIRSEKKHEEMRSAPTTQPSWG